MSKPFCHYRIPMLKPILKRHAYSTGLLAHNQRSVVVACPSTNPPTNPEAPFHFSPFTIRKMIATVQPKMKLWQRTRGNSIHHNIESEPRAPITGTNGNIRTTRAMNDDCITQVRQSAMDSSMYGDVVSIARKMINRVSTTPKCSAAIRKMR